MQTSEEQISDWVIKNHRKYIVLNKPAGISVQRTKDNESGLEQFASAYTKRDLHVINRIDRPVSGIVLMAKDSETAGTLSEVIQDEKTVKTYIAIVHKAAVEKSGKLSHYLRKTNNKAILSTQDDKRAKLAVLEYTLHQELDNYYILHVTTETGRFHQIRAQLAAYGLPIKGDVKYGARRANKDRSICLHAYRLAYHDPISGEDVVWEAKPPLDTLWDQYKA